MKRKIISNIYDFSVPFNSTRKNQAYFNTEQFTGRARMKIKAFLLAYYWWLEQ